MKLYLVHCGYYDPEISEGVYEFHTNFFVVANSALDAKNKAKALQQYQDRRMHVDGVQEIEIVDGYRINLTSEQALAGKTVVNSYKHNQLSVNPAPNA